MAQFCGNCGQPLQDAAVFCGGCGTRTAPAGAPPAAPQYGAPPPPPQYGAPPPPPPPAYGGAPQYGAPPPPPPAYGAAPQYGAPPPPPPPAYGAAPQYGAPPPPVYGAAPQYGAAPPQGDFANQLASRSDAVLGALNLQNAQGTGNVLAMMIKAAMLDGKVARAAAADVNGNGKALTAILIATAVPVGASLIFGSSYLTTAAGLSMTLVTLVLGIGMMFVSLGLMSACSKAIVGRKLSFGEIFRGLAYAQSPALLGVIPILGMLAGLWRLPTTLVALRDMVPTTMGKAFGLLLVGALASVVLSMMLMPLFMGMLGSSFSRF